jgi:uncharacterized protein
VTVRPVYLDASALAKLVLPEPESASLRSALIRLPRRVTSAIAAVEVPRIIRRVSTDPALLVRARALLNDLELVTLETEVIRRASIVEPVGLRSLDAIHLASALLLGTTLTGLITYDERLAAAARGAGVAVLQPR